MVFFLLDCIQNCAKDHYHRHGLFAVIPTQGDRNESFQTQIGFSFHSFPEKYLWYCSSCMEEHLQSRNRLPLPPRTCGLGTAFFAAKSTTLYQYVGWSVCLLNTSFNEQMFCCSMEKYSREVFGIGIWERSLLFWWKENILKPTLLQTMAI